jgi:hypothetical protein
MPQLVPLAPSAPPAPPEVARAGWRAMLQPAGVLAGALGFVAVVASVDPNQPGHYPTCPFLALTGYFCPGCGSLRAIHALAHADVATALERNPATVLAVAVLPLAFLLWSARLWSGRPRSWLAPPALIWALLAVILAYWALRNVPGWTWLSPA